MNDVTNATPYLSVDGAVQYLGGVIGKAQLARLRMTGDGPAFIRAGAKRVLYTRADLDAWLSARRATNTAQSKTLVAKRKAAAAKQIATLAATQPAA